MPGYLLGLVHLPEGPSPGKKLDKPSGHVRLESQEEHLRPSPTQNLLPELGSLQQATANLLAQACGYLSRRRFWVMPPKPGR